MNLRKVYFASFFLALIVFCLSILLLGHFMVEERVAQSMDDRLLGHINQSMELLYYLAEQLDNTLSDYASWDDTYQFTKDLNQEYIDTNLDVSYFSWLNLTALAFFDDEGALLYGSALNEEGEEDPVLLKKLIPVMTGTYPLVSDQLNIRGGLFQVNPGKVLLSVKRPVYDNSGEGTPSGSMVFVSRLSRELLESHYGLLGFPFTVEAVSPVPEPSERVLIRNETPEEAVGVSIFEDIRGDWALKLIVTQDRQELLSHIRHLRKFYLVFLMITFLLAGGAFVYLLKVIVYRIESLSYQVRQIESSNIGSRSIGTSGNDEISQLSRNINDLLNAVRDSQKELVESEDFLDRMINSLPTGIFLIDPDTWEIVDINRHALSLLERTREEVIGKKCMGLTCFTSDPYCHRMKPGDTSSILQTKIISQSGREVPIAKFISHIERNGKRYIIETLTDITEIARARSELEKSKEELERKVRDRTIRLSTIIDTVMNGIIVLNDRLEVNFFSSVAEELSGYRSDEVLNRKITFLMAEPYKTEIINALENYNGGGKPRLIGKRHKVIAIRKGGEKFSMEIAVNETYINGERFYVAVMRDITDEQRAQETIAREKERLEEMLETSPIGVGIAVGHQVKYANNALRKMGLGEGEQTTRPYDLEDFNRLAEKYLAEGYLSNYELKMTSSEGEKDILLSLYPYDYDGQEAQLGWHVDITAQKAVERELAEAKETAEEATRVKSDFLANMSHEIRTPMNAIIGLSHLAMQSGLNGKQMNYVSKVYRAAENLLSILNDILDYSKIEAGKVELEHMNFLLEDLFHDLDGILGYAREKSEIELMFDLSPDTPSYVIGDPVRLQQILTNLANNAVKFTSEGEIIIGVRAGEKKEGSPAQPYHFWVKDTGIGISVKEQEKLFRDFSQADSSTTRKYGGTGLGLAISKRLVTLMGGEIWLESRPGEGSTFHFSVDLEPREGKENETSRDEKLEKFRILIVDDSAAAREIYREMIVSFGFSVGTASSAEEGRQLLGEGEKWDVVLLDGNMPGISGRELTEMLARDPASSPKIILMTAGGSDEALNASGENPLIARVLAKPLMPSSLLNAIHDSMGIAEIRPQRRDSFNREMKQINARLNGCHVLLVEDNEINQEVALEILSRAGITADLAVNGQEAVDMVYAENYDAVLMDCQLPLMDGYEATGKIRELERFADLPIIAMTANVLSGDRERSLSSGMNDHVGKPVNPTEIYRVLDQWIGRDRNPPSAGREELESHVPLREPPRIFGLDYDEGLTLLAGNRELYFKLLGKFIDSYAAFADDFQRAEDDPDRDAAARLAHSLKGSAGNIAARHIADKAGELEAAARRRDEPARIEALESLMALLDPFILALHEYRESGREEGKIIPDNRPGRLTEEMVKKMKDLLVDSDTEAVDYLGEFVSAAEGLQLNPAFKSFVRSVERYDFEEALTQLNMIEGEAL